MAKNKKQSRPQHQASQAERGTEEAKSSSMESQAEQRATQVTPGDMARRAGRSASATTEPQPASETGLLKPRHSEGRTLNRVRPSLTSAARGHPRAARSDGQTGRPEQHLQVAEERRVGLHPVPVEP